jgi:hypothetical protein
MPVLGRFSGDAPSARAAIFGRESLVATAPKMCAAPGCVGRWSAPWKNRRRPIFEQEWGCSAGCLSKLVAAAVRRETGDGPRTDSTEPHRHRVPLGLVLLAQGWITHPQLQSALEAQRAAGGGRIGDWLAQGCGLEEERITRGLGVQWNCPVLSVDGYSPAAMALAMPKRFVAEFGMVPLRVAGSRLLYVAFEERLNAAAALGVERMSGLKVESGLLPGSQFQSARASLLAADSVPVEMKQVPDRDALTGAITRELDRHQPLTARLVRVHRYYWMRMWLESGAMPGTSGLPVSAEDVRDFLFVIG